MPVHPSFNPDYLYFITTKAERYAHIFKRESIIRIIPDSLHFLRTSGRMKLFVFVIMPNRIHMIVKSFVSCRLKTKQIRWRYYSD